MESLDIAGTFWKAGNPDRKVAGRLTRNDADGLELDLIGSLHDPEDMLAQHTGSVVRVPIDDQHSERSKFIRILGETTKGYVTLDRCIRKLGRFTWGGVPRPAHEVYKGHVALIGAHFEEDEELSFTGVTTRIQQLEHWVGMSAVSLELERDEHSNELQQMRLVTSPHKAMVARTDLGDLTLSFEYGLSGDHIVESTVRQRNTLGLRFSDLMALSDAVGVCTSLQNLVTIGVNNPVPIDTIHLSHDDLDGTVEFYAQMIGPTIEESADPSYLHDHLFSFEDIGGLQGVAKWTAVADKYRSVINALLSPVYRPQMYVEHRFFDAATAIEAFARIQGQEENINRFKLKRLGHWAGPPFKLLVGNVDKWVDQMWDARNHHVVHRGMHQVEGSHLFLLAESIYFLGVLCLLRECDVPARAFESIQEHPRFRHTRSELRRAF